MAMKWMPPLTITTAKIQMIIMFFNFCGFLCTTTNKQGDAVQTEGDRSISSFLIRDIKTQ